jgi:hypothetical protein
VKDRYSPEPLNSWTDMRAIARQEAMAVISSAGSLSSMSPGSIPFNAPLRPFVTDLPVAPTDGDEIRFLADGDAGVVWHLRYRAKAPSDYRWEFIGGSALLDVVATDEAISSGYSVYKDLGTVGPSVTIPLDGEYRLRLGVRIMHSGTDVCAMGWETDSTAASDANAIYTNVNGSGSRVHHSREYDTLELVTGDVVTAKYLTNSGTANFVHRTMSLIPVRVGRP